MKGVNGNVNNIRTRVFRRDSCIAKWGRFGVVAVAIIAIFSFGTPISFAAVNSQINYQGKLTNSSNVAVSDGVYSIVFSLYTAASGGSAIWTETQSVTVTSGLFSVMLGSVSSISSVDFNQTLYLGVNVASDGEMTPRKVIGAVPAALVADKLDNLDSTAFVLTNSTSTIATSSVQTVLTINQTSTGDILNLQDSGNEVLTVIDGGNVGIGTTTPYAKLSVVGETVSTYFTATSTTATSTFGIINVTGSATSTFSGGITLATGNVNLATGGVYLINNANVLSATALGSSVTSALGLTSVGALASGSIASGFGSINIGSNSLTAGTITGTTLNGTTGINTGAGAGTQRINSSGNLVNIGSIGLSGNITFTAQVGSDRVISVTDSTAADTDGDGITISAADAATTGGTAIGGDITIDGGTGFSGGRNGYILLGTNVASNVGIGIASPTGTLSVEMSTTNPSFIVSNTGSSTPAFYIGGVNQNGRVGLGTASPSEQLEITGNFRLPVTTASVGVIKLGSNNYLHNFGTENTFLGESAGNLTLSGSSNNTGIGFNALISLTNNGDSNTAIGHSALSSNTSGFQNTAIGASALAGNTTGTSNIAIGVGAMQSNVTGGSNISIGNSSFGAGSGSNNIAIGSSALDGTTNNSIAIGNNSLGNNTTGYSNTAVGVDS
ncbi:MAG: hypothetical protein AAB505_01410 [Patescibacteria group bacterium]